ncbi:MAG: alpha/beta hydrolase [Spongiibacteraceae bacterium]
MRKAMSGVIIAPGLHNSGPNHWQTLWQQRLVDAARIDLQRWELPIYCAGNAGHINAESGHGDWPKGWELLQRLLRIGKAAPSTSCIEPPIEKNSIRDSFTRTALAY